MARGEYKLATQSGGKGYYGVVALEVEPDTSSGQVHVDFDPKHAQDWQIGARFGIEYVLEHIPRRKLFPTGMRIKVDRIEGHVVDTNNAVIAYSAAIALLDALDLKDVRRPTLDPDKGLFVFPK